MEKQQKEKNIITINADKCCAVVSTDTKEIDSREHHHFRCDNKLQTVY